MSDKTGIEWTDATWNPIRGCSRVSEGCRNCYAESVAHRFSGKGLPYEGLTTNGKWNGKISLVEEHLEDPLRWKRPRKIFVNSMSDLFHENVPVDYIMRIFEVMEKAHWHTFQILTKRAARMVDVIGGSSGAGLDAPPLPNVWLGVSVENQKAADERIPLLLQVPAAVRWLSCEPLLGRIDNIFQQYPCTKCGKRSHAEVWLDRCNHCSAKMEIPPLNVRNAPKSDFDLAGFAAIDWVVAGGESGDGARPMHPDWARSLRDQCQAAGVPYFFKQWGEWAPFFHVRDELKLKLPKSKNGKSFNYGAFLDKPCDLEPKFKAEGQFIPGLIMVDNPSMVRVGKKDANGETLRILDGRTWDEYPQAVTA